MSWAVAQIKINAEKVATANLQRQHYEVFSPSIPLQKLRRNRLETIEAPLFPGYLLVQLDAARRWTPIGNTLGVLRLLTRQSATSEWREPCTISDRFIENLRRCSFKNGEAKWCLHPGTRVKILHGAFANHSAIVTWSNEQRCKLLLEILGRDDVVVVVDIGEVVAV